ncbi:hypothetical protein [Arthrobacter sp. H35-D1]|uniref:hypothetical protein n=1 Tax=Arthrobacter sp. H35-D1 TaxID=3046202 RepID=UPI0024BA4C96|nr:hypothetical protein [Arthrobacter sp. H35-D1]
MAGTVAGLWRLRGSRHIIAGLVQNDLALCFRGVGDELLASREKHFAQTAAVLSGHGNNSHNESNAPGKQK